jgi:type II secretory pathway pseudopilin PulG
MIELLMVIILVGVLSTVAIPQFLDFRKEGKVSALKQNLSTLRIALKNQTQQALLKCGVGNTSTWLTMGGYNFWQALALNWMSGNSITHYQADSNVRVCTNAMITNASDRPFISIAPASLAHLYVGGVDMGTQPGIPLNPFTDPKSYTVVDTLCMVDNGDLWNGTCPLIDWMNANGRNCAWLLNTNTGDIFPGTRTPGIDECYW